MKKIYINTIFKYLVYVILIIFRDIFNLNDVLCGSIIVLIAGFSGVSLLKQKLIFTPLFVAELMMICFGLFLMELLTTINTMPFAGCITIVIAMFLWTMISLSNKYIFKKPEKKNFNLSKSKYTLSIYTVYIVGILFMLLEWYVAGGVPALRSDVELFRFNVSINGITHILAIALKFVLVFSGAYFIYSEKRGVGYYLKNIRYVILIVISLLFMLGTAFRGELIFGIVIVVIAAFLYFQTDLLKLIKWAIPVIFIIAVYPIIRGYLLYGDSHIESLKSISTYDSVWFLTPLYQAFAFNFEVLNRDFLIFPGIRPYGLGSYTILCYLPFVNLSPQLGTVQNQVWGNDFYAGLTPTFFGDWYADYGYVGCIIGAAIIALFINSLYKKWIIYGTPKYLILYSYTFYQALVMVYSNTFDFVYLCYMLLIWLVFTVSRKRYGYKERYAEKLG